jgi:hypothetical protein
LDQMESQIGTKTPCVRSVSTWQTWRNGRRVTVQRWQCGSCEQVQPPSMPCECGAIVRMRGGKARVIPFRTGPGGRR